MMEARLDDARIALRAGHLDDARRLVQDILDTDPFSVEGLNILGTIEIHRKRPQEAARHFSAATARDGTAKSRMNLARAIEMLGDREQAAQVYHDVFQRFPDHAAAQASLLRVLFAAGKMTEVVEAAGPNPTTLPLDVEGFSRLAMAFSACNRPDMAESLADRALAADPFHVASGLSKASVLIAQRQHRRAMPVLRRLLILDPGLTETVRLRAEAADALNTKDSVVWLRRAVADPNAPGTLHAALAKRLTDARRFAQALPHLQAAYRHFPENGFALDRLCTCLITLGKAEDLVILIRSVLDQHPDSVATWNNLAIHLKTIRQSELAVAYLERAILLFPDNATILYNAGFTLNDLSRAEEAEVHLRRCIRIDPNYAKAWNALSVSLSIQYRAHEVDKAIQTALCLDPRSRSAWLNQGIALRAQGRLGEAVRSMRQSIAVDPKYPEGHQNLGYTLSMLGEIEQGLVEYDWRWQVPGFTSPKRPFPQPVWKGQRLPDPGNGLAIYMEQGMGDEIMFSWYLPLLRRDVRNIAVECDPRLVTLFARSFPDVRFIPRAAPLHRDFQDPTLRHKAPIGHIPKFYWAELREHIYKVWNFAGQRAVHYPAYLAPDPERVVYWKDYLRARAGGRPLIGISWRSALHTRSRDVQYLEPAEISKAFGFDVAVVNLQYAHQDDELAAFETEGRRHGFHFIHPEGINLKDDLDDVMALIAALDLIITPLISVAWMGGALGIPTWVLRTSEVSRIWQQFGTPMVPWTPSLRMFFRKPTDPWEGPLAHVRSELEAWLKER